MSNKYCKNCGGLILIEGNFCCWDCYEEYYRRQFNICANCGRKYRTKRRSKTIYCEGCRTKKGRELARKLLDGHSLEAYEAYAEKCRNVNKKALSYGYWMAFMAR